VVSAERTAAVHEARATYDEDVANYRNTVLTAFQGVEDSLSSMNHLQAQERAFEQVLDSSSRLFASEQAQFNVGSASQQSLLTQQLTLIQAQQSVRDTQALLAESDVQLVKNLGGGWQRPDAELASVPAGASSPPASPASLPVSSPASGTAAPPATEGSPD
jgi:outer membrane protein TolC